MPAYSKENFHLFFGKEDLFSNWNPRSIVYKGKVFKTCEHFMMYCKARLFGDEETAQLILDAPTPREAKRLGRKVKGFVEEVWLKHREKFIFWGCYLKAVQYPEVKALVLKVGKKIIVEASPYDDIYGVKLGKDDPRIYDPSQWQGLNLMGQAWEQVWCHLAGEDNE